MADITDIRIYKIDGTGNLKAFATVTLDNAFAVHGLKIMESDSGLWVGMPASKNKRGEFKDIFHPINKEAREVLINAVLEKYGEEA